MVDIIKAVQAQGVRVLSVVDAIETINVDHTLDAPAIRVPEGFVFAGLDVVALDLLCARYMFNMLPMAEARRLVAEGKAPSEWLQRVPLPAVEGPNIVTAEGYDSPLSRHVLFEYAERRGIGGQAYHVVGRDVWQGGRLASLQGHLGRVERRQLLGAADRHPLLRPVEAAVGPADDRARLRRARTTRSPAPAYRRQFLDAFDENGDGVIDYEEMGRKGLVDFQLHAAAYGVHLMGSEEHGMLRGFFALRANALRWADAALNPDGLDFLKEYVDSSSALVGLTLSQMEMEGADPFVPSMTWGKGKWPSMQVSRFMAIGSMIYGLGFPFMTTVDSIYGVAFQYADKAFNGSTLHRRPGDDERSDLDGGDGVRAGGCRPARSRCPSCCTCRTGYGQVLGRRCRTSRRRRTPRRMLTSGVRRRQGSLVTVFAASADRIYCQEGDGRAAVRVRPP